MPVLSCPAPVSFGDRALWLLAWRASLLAVSRVTQYPVVVIVSYPRHIRGQSFPLLFLLSARLR